MRVTYAREPSIVQSFDCTCRSVDRSIDRPIDRSHYQLDPRMLLSFHSIVRSLVSERGTIFPAIHPSIDRSIPSLCSLCSASLSLPTCLFDCCALLCLSLSPSLVLIVSLYSTPFILPAPLSLSLSLSQHTPHTHSPHPPCDTTPPYCQFGLRILFNSASIVCICYCACVCLPPLTASFLLIVSTDLLCALLSSLSSHLSRSCSSRLLLVRYHIICTCVLCD